MSAAAAMPYTNGGPAAYDPRAPNGGSGGTGERAYQHISDLQALAQQGYSLGRSITQLLETAERGLRQATTMKDFRQPDLAFVEFLRASEIVANVIPHHKDYTHFTLDQPERAKKLSLLQKQIYADSEQFKNIKKIIEGNNKRCGTRPAGSQNGHVRTDSAPAAQANGIPRTGSEGSATTMPNAHKVKPSPSPKPEKLHGRAISSVAPGVNGSNAASAQDALDARFARLRMSSIDTTQRPDSRGSNATSTHSSPIEMPSAGDYRQRAPFEPLTKTNSMPSRPNGPRGMPNGQGLPPIQIPNLPQEPPAAYSPARNMQTTGNVPPPRHSARSIASNSIRRSSLAMSSSASYQAPNGHAPSGDYFPTVQTNGTYASQPVRRKSVNPTPSLAIDRDKLYDYMNAYSVLFIDFRPREEFDQGHIFSNHVVCIEPISIKLGMSAEDVENTLVLAPENEQALFVNRDQYEVVVYYDYSTDAAYPFHQVLDQRRTGLKYLHEALTEFNQEKPLQRPPMLLRGGITAWVGLVGPRALMSSRTVEKVKAGRPLSRRPAVTAAMSTQTQLRLGKQKRLPAPLDEEEQQSWQERARAESVALPETPGMPNGEAQADGQPDGQTDEAIKEFNERFPEAGDLERQAFAGQMPVRAPPQVPPKIPEYPPPPPASAYPSVPRRPAPAAPKMSYNGVSDHAVSNNTAPSNRTSSQLAPYVPPKYNTQNLRLPRTGLVNFGNTCYMNGTLQALSACTPLSVFFIDDGFRSKLQRENWKSSKGVMSELYSNLIRSLWKGDAEVIRPTTFRSYVKRIAAQFNNDDQQDAKEFLDLLMDTLHEDLNTTWYHTPLQALTEQEEARREKMPKSIVARIEWTRYLHRDYSELTSLFAGQHASKLTCLECSFTSTTYEAFTSLSVEIPTSPARWSNGRQPSLQDCLRSYCSEEKLTKDDQWHCPRCKTFREAKKRLTLTRAPANLVIHFKRFAQSQPTFLSNLRSPKASKLRLPVDFPLTSLSLDPYMLPPPSAADQEHIARSYSAEQAAPVREMLAPYLYDCFAVVRHHGTTLQSGHYTTVARDRGRGCWRQFNDSRTVEFAVGRGWEGRRGGRMLILFSIRGDRGGDGLGRERWV